MCSDSRAESAVRSVSRLSSGDRSAMPPLMVSASRCAEITLAMNKNSETVFERALEGVLRPLCLLLLRHSFPYKAFEEIAKRIYVDVAMKDFTIAGRRQTTSRVAVLSGLSRKEVSRVRAAPYGAAGADVARYKPTARVINGWNSDAEFCYPNGVPRVLQLGGDASFTGLVKRYSRDIPARAVRDELLRTGSIQRHGDRLNLAIGTRREADVESESLRRDLADLTKTIDANLLDGAVRSTSKDEAAARPHQRRRISNCRLADEVQSDFLVRRETSQFPTA